MEDTKYRTRKMVMPGHLNGAGTLFGGKALSWIDEEAAIYASCQMKSSKLVTKIMGRIDFKSPAHMGDIVEIGVDTVKEGNTSITVRVVVRNKTTQHEIVTVDEIVFVNLNDNGVPTPWVKNKLTKKV